MGKKKNGINLVSFKEVCFVLKKLTRLNTQVSHCFTATEKCTLDIENQEAAACQSASGTDITGMLIIQQNMKRTLRPCSTITEPVLVHGIKKNKNGGCFYYHLNH